MFLWMLIEQAFSPIASPMFSSISSYGRTNVSFSSRPRSVCLRVSCAVCYYSWIASALFKKFYFARMDTKLQDLKLVQTAINSNLNWLHLMSSYGMKLRQWLIQRICAGKYEMLYLWKKFKIKHKAEMIHILGFCSCKREGAENGRDKQNTCTEVNSKSGLIKLNLSA